MDSGERRESESEAPWNYTLDRTQIDVDASLVRGLLADQFPSLAPLPIEPVGPWGTDNAMFRLGDELIVRLPRSGWAKDAVAKEIRWLPALAAELPLAVPEVIGCGAPSGEYPWTWAIYRWIPGQRPAMTNPTPPEDIAEFLGALSRSVSPDGPEPGPHNGFRGGPPAARDRWVRPKIVSGDHDLDRDALMEYWQHALALAAPRPQEARWLHGDLTPTNLVVDRGRLAAVIDWGALAVGDPACDLMIAWNFDEPERTTLRDRLVVDDGTWARGRAAAFWQWIGGVNLDLDTEPRRVVDRVLTDYAKHR